jgi:hypothetical protein
VGYAFLGTRKLINAGATPFPLAYICRIYETDNISNAAMAVARRQKML